MAYLIDYVTSLNKSRRETIKNKTIQIENHPLFSNLQNIDDLKSYIEHHIWCVWDFYVLLRAVQRGLFNMNLLWTPCKDSELGDFFYDLIRTEETDITEDGGHGSHFETYLRAMKQIGAETKPIEKFISLLEGGATYKEAMEKVSPPAPSKAFTDTTMSIATGEFHEAVASLCFGREGLIPKMFQVILDNREYDESCSIFKWYLSRHIEVDSDSHGPLSIKLFNKVIGKDPSKKEEAYQSIVKSLDARILLLDKVLQKIKTNKECFVS